MAAFAVTSVLCAARVLRCWHKCGDICASEPQRSILDMQGTSNSHNLAKMEVSTNGLFDPQASAQPANICQSIDADTITMLKQKLTNTEATRDSLAQQLSECSRKVHALQAALQTAHIDHAEDLGGLQQELRTSKLLAQTFSQRAMGYEAAFGEHHAQVQALQLQLSAAEFKTSALGKLWASSAGSVGQQSALKDSAAKLQAGKKHITTAAEESVLERSIWMTQLDKGLAGVRAARASDTTLRVDLKAALNNLTSKESDLMAMRTYLATRAPGRHLDLLSNSNKRVEFMQQGCEGGNDENVGVLNSGTKENAAPSMGCSSNTGAALVDMSNAA